MERNDDKHDQDKFSSVMGDKDTVHQYSKMLCNREEKA